jgi:hypothetical protein
MFSYYAYILTKCSLKHVYKWLSIEKNLYFLNILRNVLSIPDSVTFKF